MLILLQFTTIEICNQSYLLRIFGLWQLLAAASCGLRRWWHTHHRLNAQRKWDENWMLDHSLTYYMSSITEDGIGNANRIFEIRFGWSVRELRVLRLVRSTPGITFTALSKMTKFDRGLTSRILTCLIKAGLIERANSAVDARIYTLKATLEGAALCDQADPLTVELESLMLKPLERQEREAFLAMIDRVKTWVQEGYIREVADRYPEISARSPRARKAKN
jgi:DNA-binding MarR family transcriptional regulator